MAHDPEPSRRVLASNVRRIRDASGLTQDALGQLSGRGRNYIASLETGRITTPSALALYDIAAALGVCMETLLGRPQLPTEPAAMSLPEAQRELERRLEVMGLQPFVGMDPEQFAAYMPEPNVSIETLFEASAMAVSHLHGADSQSPEWLAHSYYAAGACAMALTVRNSPAN